MATAPDTRIWEEASRDDAVVVSRDEDFVAHVQAGGARLVWIRIGNCSNAALLAIVEANWTDIQQRLGQGDRFVELRA